MIREDYLTFYEEASKLDNLKGVKFAYWISRNKAKIEPEINAVNKASIPSPAYDAYDKERVELAKNHSKKDEKGNPVTKMIGHRSNFVIEDQKVFDSELKALQEKHKDAIEEREKQVKEVEDLLKEEITLELYRIPLNIIPEDISVEQMNIIQFLVDEDTKK